MASVRAAGTTTRSELIRTLDLSGTAIFRTTEDLAARGLLEIGPAQVHGRGQPSASIWLNANSVLAAGLAIMTDTAEAVLVDLSGTVVASEIIAIPQMGRLPVLAAFAAFIERTLNVQDLPQQRLSGIGIAIAGYFLDQTQQVNPPPELDEWALVDLSSIVGDQFDVPVEVENIARAAAIGEALLGVGKWAPSFAYINVAAGLGGAFVIDGQLQRGRLGNAGEIGGIPEKFGMAKPDLVSLHRILTARGVAVADIRQMLDTYDDHWPGIAEWVEHAAPGISLVAEIFRCVLDIDAVVIGGRIPQSLAERLIGAIDWPSDRQIGRRGQPLPYPLIVPAVLSAQSAAIGAASAFLKRHYF